MRQLLLTSFFALAAVPAFGAELEGVKLPDTATVEGKELKLNGLGIRRKQVVFVKVDVYVAGLYLEAPSKDGAAILSQDGIRRVDMSMMRDLDKKTIVEAIKAGFEKNAGDKLPALKDRLDKFAAVIPDLKKGQVLSLVYSPGKGTRVEGQGQAYVAEGKDFADALFSVYIGKFPVDEDLKKGMLGAK